LTLIFNPVIILVVDDDVHLLKAVKHLLEDEHSSVLTASGPYQAIQVLEKTEVDIIITDEVMPEMNGVELLEIVCKRWPKTYRVLFTAYSWPDTMMQSVNRGGVHKILVKGPSIQEFVDTIQQLVNDCLSQRSPRSDPPS